MRKHSIILYVVLITAVLVTAATAGKSRNDKYPAEVVFDEEYSVKKGGFLEVSVGDMDLEIKPGSENQATVKVTVSGPDMEKAIEYYEKMRFDVEISNNHLVVTTEPRRSWGMFDWNKYRRVGVLVEITIPSRFDVDAKTSDGDLTAEGLEGEIKLKSSDGDVDVSDMRGPLVSMRTSDGDVRATHVKADEIVMKSSDGDVDVKDFEGKDVTMTTSDGDISVREMDATEVTMGSSDGDIVVKSLKARSAQIRTSDGDVNAEISGEELRIKTSDGDINLEIDGTMAVNLSTSDGNVVLSAPADIKADISLRGSRVKLLGVEGFAIDGDVSSHHIAGKLNKGGPKVTVRASDGTVALDLRKDT